jgi:hypothetical protein
MNQAGYHSLRQTSSWLNLQAYWQNATVEKKFLLIKLSRLYTSWKDAVQNSLICAHDFDVLLTYRCITNCHFGIAFTSPSQSNTIAH